MGSETDRRTRTVSWDDPLAVLRAASGSTGLELLQQLIDERLPPPPIAMTLDFRLVEVSEGRAVFHGEPGEFLYNPIGSVHGGYAMTLLDSAMGCAIHTTLQAGERYTTLEVKTNFVRPITIDTGTVRCEGVVVHRGATVATAEGKIVATEIGRAHV